MIDTLQSLRGIFAICIFLHHFPHNGKGWFEAGGSLGVEYFLMLSGFVMTIGYGKKVLSEGFRYKEFFLKRIIRIYPLHFLCLAGWIMMNILSLTVTQFIILIPNALLLQSFFPKQEIYFSGNAVSWCLSDLMLFYGLFPFLIIGINKEFKIFSLGFLSFIGICFAAIPFVNPDFYHYLYYICPITRLISFVFGIYLWMIIEKWIASSQRQKFQLSYKVMTTVEILVLFFISCVVVFWKSIPAPYSFSLYWWLPICLIIITFTTLTGGGISKMLNYKWLVVFGNWSFSFYMIHLMGINFIQRVLIKMNFDFPFIVNLLLTFVIVLIVTAIVHLYFVERVSVFLKKKLL